MQPLPIQDQILNATNPGLGEPDLALNLNISDVLKSHPNSRNHAIHAINARLDEKNPKACLLAIELVDVCVKNCAGFVPFVAHKNTLDRLAKLGTKKNRRPNLLKRIGRGQEADFYEAERADRALKMIQVLSHEFGARFPLFERVYRDLLSKGVKFPTLSKNEVAPGVTPPARAPPAARFVKYPATITDLQQRQELAELLWTTLNTSPENEDLQRNDIVQQLVDAVRAGAIAVRQEISAQFSGALTGRDDPVRSAECFAVNERLQMAIDFYEQLLAGVVSRPGEPPEAPEPVDEVQSGPKAPQEPVVVPKLAPPGSPSPAAAFAPLPSPGTSAKSRKKVSKRSRKRAPTGTESTSESFEPASPPADALDSLDDLLSFAPPPSRSGAAPPASASAPADSASRDLMFDDDEDDDDFFAIATRGGGSGVAPVQQQQAAAAPPAAARSAPPSSSVPSIAKPAPQPNATDDILSFFDPLN